MLLAVAGLVLLVFNLNTQVPTSWGMPAGPRGDPLVIFDKLFRLIFQGAFTGALGALILGRHPGNRIGWLLVIGSVLVRLESLATDFAIYALFTAPGTLPGGLLAAWLINGLWAPIVGLILWSALVFPDGSAANAGWRPGLWWAASTTLAIGVLVLGEHPMSSAFYLDNPFLRFAWEGVTEPAWYIMLLLFALSIPAVAVSVVARWRRARGAERQQFKWLAMAAVATAVLGPAGIIWSQLFGALALGGVITNTSLPLLTVAIGVAVLQYRLYDVDLIINRTLVYGALTAALVAVYFASVIVLQTLFRGLTGQTSQLAVVGSTLAIAALFNPLRRNVQALVDRRFYRRKYDAAQTLAAFSAAARDETNLDRLAGRLVEVVDDTVQPAHISLWLAKPRASEPGGLT